MTPNHDFQVSGDLRSGQDLVAAARSGQGTRSQVILSKALRKEKRKSRGRGETRSCSELLLTPGLQGLREEEASYCYDNPGMERSPM